MSLVARLWAVEAFSVAALVSLGLFCIVGNRNFIKIFMGVSILTRAAALAFLVGGVQHARLGEAQTMIIAVTVVDATVTAVGMSMVVNIYRHYGSVDSDKLRRLHG